ncbi:hypothetical protein [Flavobacterium sp. PL12]|uniref:hypothetical protein n=1 Tax=Flavobacterium sp. PL12 TaxID=3071718 RepID=UPI00319EA824
MKSYLNFGILFIALLAFSKQYAQHRSTMNVEMNSEKKTLIVTQELLFFNESKDTLTTIVLNDWNNAYSNKYAFSKKVF